MGRGNCGPCSLDVRPVLRAGAGTPPADAVRHHEGTSAASRAPDPSEPLAYANAGDRSIECEVAAPASSLYFGFASLAVYDAVVTIEGRYEPWMDQPRAHANASSEAAAATAAYHVLRHFFPTSADALAADYATSLASIPNGVGKVHGTRVGAAAAAALIAERAGDGRDAAVPQPGDGSPGPGDWRPTPPANAPMAVPWLGFVDPLVLESATPVALSGPPALDSPEYAADFAEVRDYGGRSPPGPLSRPPPRCSGTATRSASTTRRCVTR